MAAWVCIAAGCCTSVCMIGVAGLPHRGNIDVSEVGTSREQEQGWWLGVGGGAEGGQPCLRWGG